jgi:hypothetical protein
MRFSDGLGASVRLQVSFLWDTDIIFFLAAVTIYPSESHCTNDSCENQKPLKKDITRRVVVYTLANGVQPAWAAHLYCPSMVEVLCWIKYILRLVLGFTACQTDYHNNFSVHDGVRTYHREFPRYVQVGEHQFVEQTVVRMWINQMLIGW